MKNKYEIAEIIFDACRNAKMRSNTILRWSVIDQHFQKELNPKERDLSWVVVDILCKNKYIQLNSEGGFIQWLVLLDRGYDYIYSDDVELDLSGM